MAGGTGSRRRSRPRARAATGIASLPRRRPLARLGLRSFLPSGRSLAVGLALLVAGGLAYGYARSSDAFAVSDVRVQGAPQQISSEVRAALAHVEGQSLLRLRLATLDAALERLPWVASATLDREFPQTLAVVVVTERPAAVLRQGAASWLVAASGRVLETLEPKHRPPLPRIWLERDVGVEVGRSIQGVPLQAVRAVSPLAETPLPGRVASVRASHDELTLVLRTGFEVRLGDATERALKLEVARRLLPTLPSAGYLDVSVPKFPVFAGSLNPQVKVESSDSISG